MAMTTTHSTTPRDLLRYAVTRFNAAKLFFGHGSAEALDEAAYLILHTLKLPLDKLDPFLDARLLPEEVLQVLAVIERRVSERVPAAYITNEAWLGSYNFYVDERVLVPRSFIAELIPESFSPVGGRRLTRVENVLELCTGSGCLAIMMADAFPNARGRCGRHFAGCAGGGRAQHPRLQAGRPREPDRVRPVRATCPFKKYDLIVTNPPYVNCDSMAQAAAGIPARAADRAWPAARTAWTWCARSSTAPPSA